MLLFNPMTGLTHLGLFSAPTGSSDAALDLLESQRASLYYSCDCGTHSSHEVVVSVRLDDPEAPMPNTEAGTPVRCPACGHHGFLQHPQILHDPKQEEVILRLPAGDRSRTLAVLSAWFLTLQASGRSELPPYALQPVVEYFDSEESSPSTSEEIKAVSKEDVAELVQAALSNDDKSTVPLRIPQLPSEEEQLVNSLEDSVNIMTTAVEEEEEETSPGITQDLKSPMSEESMLAAEEPAHDFAADSEDELEATGEHKITPAVNSGVFPFPTPGSRAALTATEVAFAPPPTEVAVAPAPTVAPVAPTAPLASIPPTAPTVAPVAPPSAALLTPVAPELPPQLQDTFESTDFLPPVPVPEPVNIEIDEHTTDIDDSHMGLTNVVPNESLPDLEAVEVEVSELLEPEEELQGEGRADVPVEAVPQNLKHLDDEAFLSEDGFELPETRLTPIEIVLEEDTQQIHEEELDETNDELDKLVLKSTASTSEQLKTVDAPSEDTMEHTPTSSEELLEMEEGTPRFETFSSLDSSPDNGGSTLVAPSPRRPNPAPASVVKESTNIDLEAPDSMEMLKRELGSGITLYPTLPEEMPVQRFARSWHKKDTNFSFGYDPKAETCVLNLLVTPELLKELDNGGSLRFLLQLHRMPTYPMLTFIALFDNAEQENIEYMVAKFDIDDPNVLIFLDMLMQHFTLRVQFCLDRKNYHRVATFQWPLEQNIEYYLNEARAWKDQLESVDFVQGGEDLEDPEYDLVGRMNHNFHPNTFEDLSLPSQTRLAIGIVSYWSEHAQEMYLIERKSFPIVYFQEIQTRVLKASIAMGLKLPDHLIHLALEWEMGTSPEELWTRMINNFAELNLQIQFTNDLDPWDNLENWHLLFEIAENLNIEINENIEEIAEIAQRRCHEEQEIMVESVEDFEIVEDLYDMGNTDLLDLLVEPEYRLESAVALAEKLDPEMLPRIASVYADLATEEIAPYMEALLKFGQVVEMYLLQWAGMTSKLHRGEALKALGKLKSEPGIAILVQALHSRDVWEAASEGLVSVGEAALPFLAAELQNPNWIVRLRTVKTVARIGGENSPGLLQRALDDENEMVRNEAHTQLQL